MQIKVWEIALLDFETYKTVPKAVDLAHTDVLDVISVTKKRHFCKNMSAFCFILCWRVEGGREGQEHGGKGAGSG